MIHTGKATQGFTLIELMVTMAIGVVLMTVAVPSFTAYQRNAELTSATNTLLASINAARSEAMKVSANAMVVPTGNASDWTTGWIVFVDNDRSRTYTSPDTVVLSQGAMKSYFSVSGSGTAIQSPPYIMFNASGYATTKAGGPSNLTIQIERNDISGTDLLAQTRRIKIAITGRSRSCKPISPRDENCSPISSQVGD